MTARCLMCGYEEPHHGPYCGGYIARPTPELRCSRSLATEALRHRHHLGRCTGRPWGMYALYPCTGWQPWAPLPDCVGGAR